MTGVIEQRHLTDGASLPAKALGFTFVATPTYKKAQHVAGLLRLK